MPILLFFVMGAIILGPLAVLIHFGRRELYLKLSPSDQRDFLVGFLGAILVNAALAGLFFATNLWIQRGAMPAREWAELAIQLAPWVINGLILGLALIFRPKIASGVLGLIGLLIAWAVFSFVLFVAGCSIIILISGILSM